MTLYVVLVTHLQIIAAIVKSMTTLIITRRLHLIASLESVELPSKAAVGISKPSSTGQR